MTLIRSNTIETMPVTAIMFPEITQRENKRHQTLEITGLHATWHMYLFSWETLNYANLLNLTNLSSLIVRRLYWASSRCLIIDDGILKMMKHKYGRQQFWSTCRYIVYYFAHVSETFIIFLYHRLSLRSECGSLGDRFQTAPYIKW